MSRLFVVGIGAGGRMGMTGRALAALELADVVCGYDKYVEQVRDIAADKEVIATGMTHEVERCRLALAAAAAGKTVAVVCSGDAGVYGMAGLLCELGPDADIEVVPGVTAALSGAAVLGAPLMHDFAIVSLSDLLTPWEVIARRLAAAAAADFVLVLYNPGSSARKTHLSRACGILLQHRAPGTVCGWVRAIGTAEQQSGLLRLDELCQWQADMQSIVFVGNAATRRINGRMVTPRGYEETRA